METQALAAITIIALQGLLKAAPDLFASITQAMSKETVTDEDFEALKQQIKGDTYEKLVPDSKLENIPVADPTPPQPS